MNKKFTVKLIPIGEISDNDFFTIASRCRYNRDFFINGSYPNTIFSPESSINITVSEKNGKYYEVNTNREILMKSISDGYIAIFVLSNIKVNSNNNEIVSFLNEAKYKVKTLNTGISEYIFDVLSNEERIVNHINKTIKNNPSVTFKWVHVYDFDSKGFNRYLLPIRNDNYRIIVNENEYNILDIYPNNTDLYSNKKYHEDFNSKFHNYESTNGFIYIEKTYVIPERNNFELLSAVYETMINGESINNKIDRAIENSKYKMKIKSLI